MIKQQLQFYFQDLTQEFDAGFSPTGGSYDFYRWRVLETPSGTSKSNVYATDTPAFAYGNIPSNSLREGWAFNATGNQATSPIPTYHLIYVKEVTSGTLSPVAYANIVPNSDNLRLLAVPGNSFANLPADSRSWQCIKCTPAANNGICAP
jgi:hypothetical protein